MRVPSRCGCLLLSLGLAAAMPGIAVRAQNVPDSRIDAIERQIQRLQQDHERQTRDQQQELQLVLQEMATQSDQLKQSQDQAKASQEEARQARAAAAQTQAQPPTPSKPVVTPTEKGVQIGGGYFFFFGFIQGAGGCRPPDLLRHPPTRLQLLPSNNSVLAPPHTYP